MKIKWNFLQQYLIVAGAYSWIFLSKSSYQEKPKFQTYFLNSSKFNHQGKKNYWRATLQKIAIWDWFFLIPFQEEKWGGGEGNFPNGYLTIGANCSPFFSHPPPFLSIYCCQESDFTKEYCLSEPSTYFILLWLFLGSFSVGMGFWGSLKFSYEAASQRKITNRIHLI